MAKKVYSKDIPRIEDMLNNGCTLKEVGDYFGVSKQRIAQIVEAAGIILNPYWGSSKVAIEKREKERAEYYTKFGFYPEEKKKYITVEGRKLALLISAAKQRAKERNIEFNIRLIDFYPYPTHCPVYGTELDYVNGTQADRWQSPSLDRLDNTKGYVKGNVAIISWKANYFKSDACLDDIEKLYKYLTKVNI